MKKLCFVFAILLAVSLVLLGGCADPAPAASPSAASATTPPAAPEATATPAAATAQPEKPKSFQKLDYDSKAIAMNITGDKPVQNLYVLLPPSYHTTDKRYPVVYYVNGFDMPPGGFISGTKLRLAEAMAAGSEFIIVEIDALNQNGGSFLVNSPVSGNWEDYAVNEVIPFIDGQFRTVADASGRGIAGFSMGGFAAINLALRHPDVFCATYALCPGLFDENGLADAMKIWRSYPNFLRAYGQAFCPMPDVPDTFSAIPAMDGSEADKPIVKNWESGFGSLKEKIDDYLALGIPLKAIAVEYGESDSYGWIPKGCVYFSKLLTERGIGHTLTGFKGGHIVPVTFPRENMVRFFGEAFQIGPSE